MFLGEVGANVQFKSVRRLQAKFEIQRDSFELEQRTEKQNKSIFKTNPRNATSLCLSLVDIEVISGAIESLPIFAQYSSFRPSTFEMKQNQLVSTTSLARYENARSPSKANQARCNI